MKKLLLCTIVLLLMFGAVSCSKDKLVIKADEISVNTMLALTNGALQVATVEEFDKSYYKLSELNDYVKKQIDLYNQKASKEKISIDDIEVQDNKAFMILSYAGMEAYSTFNGVYAAYFNGGTDVSSLDLPTTLINAKNDSLASTEEILKSDKYKILVLNEPFDILVEGKVKYYSENAVLSEENKVQGAAEGMTVVVFK